jgi:hypothetical protein
MEAAQKVGLTINLVINHKTANALGASMPAQFYIFADEVISSPISFAVH